jgi:DNA-binding response OmpR family regulator
MPIMDGLESIGVMLKRKLHVPVIIFSAFSGYRNDAPALAADAYVVKSSTLSEVKVRMHEVV